LTDRGGLLRTGISMYTSEPDVERLLDGIERLT
jgi:selenocysteine lyase/cysteine desulfurase